MNSKFKVFAVSVALSVAFAIPVVATTGYYINSDGQKVSSPVKSFTTPKGATAKCKDGTYSFSKHRSGTCSGHRGVSKWL